MPAYALIFSVCRQPCCWMKGAECPHLPRCMTPILPLLVTYIQKLTGLVTK